MLHPHVAVEVLQQPLPALRKQSCHLVAPGVEVLAVHHSAWDRLTPGMLGQLRVESPFVGLLVFEGANVVATYQRIEVVRQRLPVVGIVDRQVAHAVPGRTQLAGQIAHRGKDGDDLLRVVQDVVGFLAHFDEGVQHVVAPLREPAVPWIELVAEYQPQGRAGTHAISGSSPLRGRCGKPCCRSAQGKPRSSRLAPSPGRAARRGGRSEPVAAGACALPKSCRRS